MIKMVVSSFYNALIDKEEAIPTSTMLEIERIRKKGILFSVCTNRLYQEVLDYNKDFPFLDYIISLNGSYIYDVAKDKCLQQNKLTSSTTKKIAKIYEGYPIYFYTEQEVLKSLEEVGEKSIYKIEVELKDIKDIKKIQKLNVESSIFQYQEKKYLEITSHKSSMFSGVDQVSLKTGTNLKEIVAICSNESDYSLVKNITRSYIVENSCEKLKKATKRITSSNDNKGVENILKRIK